MCVYGMCVLRTYSCHIPGGGLIVGTYGRLVEPREVQKGGKEIAKGKERFRLTGREISIGRKGVSEPTPPGSHLVRTHFAGNAGAPHYSVPMLPMSPLIHTTCT